MHAENNDIENYVPELKAITQEEIKFLKVSDIDIGEEVKSEQRERRNDE